MKSFSEGGAGQEGRLFRRYLLFIGGGITLVLALAIAVETTLSYRETLSQVGEVQLAEVHSAAAQVEQYLANVEATLVESAGIPWSQPPFGAAEAKAEYYRLLKSFPRSIRCASWTRREIPCSRSRVASSIGLPKPRRSIPRFS